MNAVHIVGRLTGDPEMRQTPSGVTVASFYVAVDRGGKDNGADFIRCVAWRETGENIARYFVKGKPIEINGHIRVDSYKDKDGNNRSIVDIVVDRWGFVPSDSMTRSAAVNADADDFQEVDGLDDLPF